MNSDCQSYDNCAKAARAAAGSSAGFCSRTDIIFPRFCSWADIVLLKLKSKIILFRAKNSYLAVTLRFH